MHTFFHEYETNKLSPRAGLWICQYFSSPTSINRTFVVNCELKLKYMWSTNILSQQNVENNVCKILLTLQCPEACTAQCPHYNKSAIQQRALCTVASTNRALLQSTMYSQPPKLRAPCSYSCVQLWMYNCTDWCPVMWPVFVSHLTAVSTPCVRPRQASWPRRAAFPGAVSLFRWTGAGVPSPFPWPWPAHNKGEALIYTATLANWHKPHPPFMAILEATT